MLIYISLIGCSSIRFKKTNNSDRRSFIKYRSIALKKDSFNLIFYDKSGPIVTVKKTLDSDTCFFVTRPFGYEVKDLTFTLSELKDGFVVYDTIQNENDSIIQDGGLLFIKSISRNMTVGIRFNNNFVDQIWETNLVSNFQFSREYLIYEFDKKGNLIRKRVEYLL
jgi:hypothetical protein